MRQNKPSGDIYWFYKVQKDDFEQNLNMYNEMVTMNWLKEHELAPNSTSVGSHHYNVNIIFLCQNLFSKNRYF